MKKIQKQRKYENLELKMIFVALKAIFKFTPLNGVNFHEMAFLGSRTYRHIPGNLDFA